MPKTNVFVVFWRLSVFLKKQIVTVRWAKEQKTNVESAINEIKSNAIYVREHVKCAWERSLWTEIQNNPELIKAMRDGVIVLQLIEKHDFSISGINLNTSFECDVFARHEQMREIVNKLESKLLKSTINVIKKSKKRSL